MRQKIVSEGAEIVRREEIDSHTTVVVCVASNDSDYEWGIIHDGRVQVESFMGYGDPQTALRDALMYVACGQVLYERAQGLFSLAKVTAFVYPASKQPLLEV